MKEIMTQNRIRRITPVNRPLVILLATFCLLLLESPAAYATSTPMGSAPAGESYRKEAQPLWIATVGRLYMKEDLTAEERLSLFTLLEEHLGIHPDGSLDISVTRKAADELHRYTRLKKRPFTHIYFDDKLSLTGYHYIYLETCVLNQALETKRFIAYFENGFYPNRSLFVREEHYYKSLYYYLYLTQDALITAINNTVSALSSRPDALIDFPEAQIRRLEIIATVCTELDNLKRGTRSTNAPWERIFTKDEAAWIEASIAYFTSMETHIALNSYDGFKRTLPLSISSRIISHGLNEAWIKQSASHRTVLPLMLFIDHDTKEFSVERLFHKTLSMLKLDNREVDLLVLSAMKSWLLKQIEKGVRVEDRIRYKEVLDELNICPSGWIFYNLYACRAPLKELKQYVDDWEGLPLERRKQLFKTEIQPRYDDAKTKIDLVFSDLEKIFGTEEIYGHQYKASSINPIFHRYRGEIDYTYEYLQAGLYGTELATMRLPLANAPKNCLHDFTAAFVKAPERRINHLNLLNAYTLLFRELTAQGKMEDIARHENEMEELIRSKAYTLGDLLDHEEDARYLIYHIIADAYLSTPPLRTRALAVAERCFTLARAYFIEAARREGFISGTLPGAFSFEATEVDDYERQYEYFQTIAESLGKKILFLLPQEDVDLYNRMRDSKTPEGYLL